MQKGFIQLSLTGYIALGLGTIILILGTLLKIQTARLDSANEKLAVIEALGLEAQKRVKQIEAQAKINKDKADEELKKSRTNTADLVKRLRDSRSGGLPEAPRDSPKPELICFDRAELGRAYGELVKDVRGLADEGTENTIRLNNAREWVKPIGNQ